MAKTLRLMQLNSICNPSVDPPVYLFVLLTYSISAIGQDNAVPGEKGISVAGQITILIVLLLVGFIFWQLTKVSFGEIIFRKLATWVVAGSFLALVGVFLFLVLSVFMAGQINAGVVLGMVSGIICILILLQAIKR